MLASVDPMGGRVYMKPPQNTSKQGCSGSPGMIPKICQGTIHPILRNQTFHNRTAFPYHRTAGRRLNNRPGAVGFFRFFNNRFIEITLVVVVEMDYVDFGLGGWYNNRKG